MARITWIVVGVAVALALAADVSVRAEERRERYQVGVIGDLPAELLLCDDDPRNPTGQNIGAVCFEVDRGQRVTVTVTDDVISPVGFFWVFSDAHGNFTFGRDGPDLISELIETCTLCGDECAGPLRTVVPPEAVSLLVVPHGPIIDTVECGLVGMGTTGTVALTAGSSSPR